MNVPGDLKYSKTHEWVRMEGDLATIGITDFAQSELGDIVYVDLPSPGRNIQEDQTIGSLESVKTVSDIYAPFPGEVVEVNGSLGVQSELINKDPYGQGWIVKMRPLDPGAAAALLDADTYRASLDR